MNVSIGPRGSLVRRTSLLTVAALALAACGQGRSGSSAPEVGMLVAGQGPEVSCGAQVVTRGNFLLVTPSGGEDTAALQCALDVARGRTVSLAAGEFHLAQLVATGFTGHLEGAGAGRTILTNLGTPLPVTAVDYWREPPSAANPWPALISFVDGAFGISDLTVWIRGAEPTVGWTSHGFSAKALGAGISITGTAVIAEIKRIDMRGEDAPDDPFGLNLINGIFTWNIIGSEPAPLQVRLSVHNSAFRHLGSALPVANLGSSDVDIQANRFEDGIVAAEIQDLSDSRYAFIGNVVRTMLALDQYDFCASPSSACGVARSTVQIAGNDSTGPVLLEGTMLDVQCRVVGNAFDLPAEAPPVDVLLAGPGTQDCLVAGPARVVTPP